jgi:hypothetical protein
MSQRSLGLLIVHFPTKFLSDLYVSKCTSLFLSNDGDLSGICRYRTVYISNLSQFLRTYDSRRQLTIKIITLSLEMGR